MRRVGFLTPVGLMTDEITKLLREVRELLAVGFHLG